MRAGWKPRVEVGNDEQIFREALIKSLSTEWRIFCLSRAGVQDLNWEIHTVFLQFKSLRLKQNPRSQLLPDESELLYKTPVVSPFGLLWWKKGNVNLRCLRQRMLRSIIMATTEGKEVVGSSAKIETKKRRLAFMLNENIRAIRKSKGLSQQELAVKLNVVRQTVSKWEQGLSVPDSGMLISISETLETSVSTLLGENVMEQKADDLKAISAKLEVINMQLAQRKTTRKRILHWLFISLCAVIAATFAILLEVESPYLLWDYSEPETAVLAVAFHAVEWLFVRAAPILFIAGIIGIFLTRNKE